MAVHTRADKTHLTLDAPYTGRTLHRTHPTLDAPYTGRTLHWTHRTLDHSLDIKLLVWTGCHNLMKSTLLCNIRHMCATRTSF